jgi:hypothetical protein
LGPARGPAWGAAPSDLPSITSKQGSVRAARGGLYPATSQALPASRAVCGRAAPQHVKRNAGVSINVKRNASLSINVQRVANSPINVKRTASLSINVKRIADLSISVQGMTSTSINVKGLPRCPRKSGPFHTQKSQCCSKIANKCSKKSCKCSKCL